MANKSKAAAKTPAKAAAKGAEKPAAKGADKASKAAAKAKPLTKTQLISHLSEKFELTKKVAGELLQAIADLAIFETKRAGQFVFPGLGKLVKAQRKARVGINPKTKEKIKIPAKTVVKFRVAKSAKESISPLK